MAKKNKKKALPVAGLTELPDALDHALRKVLVLNTFRIIEKVNDALHEAGSKSGSEKDEILEDTLRQAHIWAEDLVDFMEVSKTAYEELFKRFGIGSTKR